MRAFTVALALLGGCSSPGSIDVSGTVFDFERWVRGTMAGDTRAAHQASVVPGVIVYLAEDSQKRSLTTGADGAYRIPEAPAEREIHPVAARVDGFLRTEDGIGVQFAEGDVTDYAVGILPQGALFAALAGGFGITVDALQEQGFQLFVLLDRPFPDGAPLTDGVVPSVTVGTMIHVGWDAAASAFVTADSPTGFAGQAVWLGIVAVTTADTREVRVLIHDEARGPGRPKIFVQHPMAVEPGRAMLFLLSPVN